MTGRPSNYTPELGDRICVRLASGESLLSICEDDGMPNKSSVLLWVVKGDRGEEPYVGFSAQYARAREAQAEAIMDEIVAIADGCSGSKDDVHRDRLRVDTRLKALARMHPKKYSERIEQTITGSVVTRTMTDEQLESRITDLLGKAGIASLTGGEDPQG